MSDEDTPLPLSLPRAHPEPVIVERGPETQKPPSSVRERAAQAVKKSVPQGRAQTIVAITALVTALGGGAGIAKILGPSDEILAEVRESKRSQDELKTAIVYHMWRTYDVQFERETIRDAVICKLNQGKPFARKMECDKVKDWESVPLGQELVGPFKAQWDYPSIPEPPFPRPEPK